MKATVAISIAAPALAFDPRANELDECDDLGMARDACAELDGWLVSNGIDANSVMAIDVSADGSVEAYEG